MRRSPPEGPCRALAGISIDGDGVADLLVGAPYASTGGADAGAVDLLFGIDEP